MSSTPVFIIAQQRSGTNLLRRSLATTGRFCDSDEIFDPKNDSYWPYFASQAANDVFGSLPTTANRTGLFERFLDSHLDNKKPFTLIDVKYNSTHLLDGMWQSPVDEPSFIQWLVEKKYPVIHLLRANCLENYVSLMAGHHTGRWVVGKTSEKPRPIQLRLDPEETIFQIRRREREIERFRRLLARTNHMELEYESLIDRHSGDFAYPVAQQIFHFLGSDPNATIQVPTRKTGRPIRKTIENYDHEILPALIENGMAGYDNGPCDNGLNDSSDGETEMEQLETKVVAVLPRPALFYIPRVERRGTKSKPVFVVSMQRSGSNLLRQSLASSASFHDLNEIFDPFQKKYWPTWEKRVEQQPELAVPTAEHQLDLFESFLDDQLDHDAPFTLIDVKYNSTQHLNDVWYHPGARPILMEWFIEQKCPVVHLVRENVFESYVSNVVTCHINSGSHDTPAPSEHHPIRLDAVRTLRSIQMFQSQIEVMRTWLAPTNHIELRYESLLDSTGKISGMVNDQIGDLLKMEAPIDMAITTEKSNRSKPSLIENFESEIAPALRRNGYGQWLSEKAA